MTLEQYLNKKKAQFSTIGYDVADLQDWTNDFEAKRQYKGFNDDQLQVYVETLDTQIRSMQEKLEVAEREQSRRKAEKWVTNLTQLFT